MSDNSFKWYVLKAISGKEQKVKEYIDASCKTSDMGRYVNQVVVPTEKTVVVRQGKRMSKERMYLPGYVLVEARAIKECASRLRQTPNALGWLPDDRNPAPVRQSEINRIFGNVDEQETRDIEEFPFLVGEMVKVTDGPFNGFNGVINEILSDKKKLKVEVTIFGRKTPLELSFNQVDKE